MSQKNPLYAAERHVDRSNDGVSQLFHIAQQNDIQFIPKKYLKLLFKYLPKNLSFAALKQKHF
jgi:hypothetical protein